MTEAASVPANEKEILRRLVDLRNKLNHIKQDRHTFIQSSDITPLYHELTQQVYEINQIRSDPSLSDEQNRVDVVLDDVFQLLSLMFLTVGLNNTAPGVFASLCTVKRLLDHLLETCSYTESDLDPIQARLQHIHEIVDHNTDLESVEIIQLIRNKLNLCDRLMQQVVAASMSTSPELIPLLRQLIHLKREILSAGSKPTINKQTLWDLQKQLHQIDSSKVDGLFLSQDGQVPQGQGALCRLLDNCQELLSDFLASKSNVHDQIKPYYDSLCSMKADLENLLVTHRWTLRETDLYHVQQRLQEIDDLRRTNKFVDPHSNEPLPGSSMIAYLLRRCYAIVYKLLESSQPVSEALMPIHNQLNTVRKCLLEVKRVGGLSTTRELYPYQMKLASIDNLRTDGKFVVSGQIPEGQGMLSALVAECFEICHELQVELAEKSTPRMTQSG